MIKRVEKIEKSRLRQVGIKVLEDLSGSKKEEKERVIRGLLFNSRLWREAQGVAMIRSTSIELDTQPIMTRGFAEGKRIYVPVASPHRVMTFHEVTATTHYLKSKFGIQEPIDVPVADPTAIDLVIVPGVVFRSSGHRIGFGAGYYDAFLANYQGRTCSLVFAEQLNEDWQPEAFDVPVQRIFTDSE